MRIAFRAQVGADDLARQVGPIEAALTKLGRGFTLVTDLSDLDAMDLDCVTHVTRIMDLCRNGGVGKVVRIIPNPDKDIGFNLLSLVHYRGKVPTATCETKAEAEKELARP